MEIESHWLDSSWFVHLKIPLFFQEDWARTGVEFLEFDPALLNCLSEWQMLVATAEAQFFADVRDTLFYKRRMDDAWCTPERRQARINYEQRHQRRLITEAFKALSVHTGETVARDFENWVKQFYFSEEFGRSLNAWFEVFCRLRSYQGSDPQRRERWERTQVPIPACLAPLAPVITAMKNSSSPLREEISWNLKRARGVTVPEGDNERRGYQACCLKWAISSTARFKALQIVANNLTESEIQLVVAWANEQVLHLWSTPQALQGAKYICKTLPRCPERSVFDIPEAELYHYSADCP